MRCIFAQFVSPVQRTPPTTSTTWAACLCKLIGLIWQVCCRQQPRSCGLYFTSLCSSGLHPQRSFQKATPVWATCVARWATPTCATQSRFWPWPRRSLSTRSGCKYNPSESPPASSLQVQRLPFVTALMNLTSNGHNPTHLSALSSGGVSGGSGPDAYPHHRRRVSCWAGADRPHRLSHRQEEEPRWIPDHLIQMNTWEQVRVLQQVCVTWKCLWWGVHGFGMWIAYFSLPPVLSLWDSEKPRTCCFDMLCILSLSVQGWRLNSLFHVLSM